MKISLLHPSRGRPVKSFMNTSEWISKAGDVEVEVICAVDLSDPTREEYQKHYKKSVILTPSNDVVMATNFAAKECTGDIMLYLSDDFKCPEKWGELVVKEFENENRPLVLRVNDTLQRFETPIITIPIMNRQLYTRLGYFWHPAYKSMFVDEDLYWTAMSIGAVKNCPNLIFPHHHHSNPDVNKKAEWDETYRKSEGNWDQGKETFRRRKLEKFKI